MLQISIATPSHFTYSVLVSIVAKASLIWERLNSDDFTVDKNQSDESEISRRCKRWCEVAGQDNENIINKRLQWEGLNLETVRPYLGTVHWSSQKPLPQWAETLRQIMQTAAQFNPNVETFLENVPENTVPFEDILLPIIKVARQQLLSRIGCLQLAEDIFPLSILSKAAYRSLERSLLKQLAMLSTKTLDLEFSQVRPFGQSLLYQLGLETEINYSKTYYTKFVHQLLQDGLLSLFQKYPVLARLMTTAVNFWVETTAEFIERLVNDKEDIQQIFGSKTSNGKVVEITTSLSDPHNQGRTVILLTFESGLKLVYKPKDLGLEAAFNQFLNWCNQHSQLLDFKIIQVLNRHSYGWVEFVEHQPCADEAAAERFYQRAGMLLCLLYTLRGTDCHNENLIASGEHLVLIDMETLLHHEANVIEDSPDFQAMETQAGQHLWDSVLRTGLLPRWDFSADKRIAYDISGLSSTDPQQAPQKVFRWQAINTDNMYLQSETVTMPIEKNVPVLDNKPLFPNDYQKQIADGFEQMYRFLMAHKEVLLGNDSPLALLQNQQVRFIFRATRIYFTILQRTWTPDYLKHGVDYSIELDYLSQAFLVAQEQPNAWPILAAELRAMEQLDIPFFTANTTSDTLSLHGMPDVQQYFKMPSYDQVLKQIQTADETDLGRQKAIILGSFYAKVAQTSTANDNKWQVESLPLLTSEELIEAAKEIASEIEVRAIHEPDGSLNWISMGYVPEAERFQLQVLGNNLYNGRCGIALFLAALYKITGQSQFRELALRTLQSLRQQMRTLDIESQQRFARFTGIGGATGLGSMIYTLVKVSQFLKDDTLLADAQHLADLITPELIEADKQLDIIGGAAGAILGLLSLYKVTNEVEVLEKAMACGQHLLNQQMSYEGSPKTWNTITEKPLTGFSHGAAGIAYALLQLYSVTQNQAFLKAASEGIDYERSVFSKPNVNWPDFRGAGQDRQPSFLVQWCHGASGIGLGRLGSFKIAEDPEMEQEIEIALRATQDNGLKAVDHLCCGNMGRIEVLLVGAQRCSRSDWHQLALQNATNVVARAKRTGAYQLFANLPSSVFNPGFFQGTAGIGYQLLRLAYPEKLPSVLLWE